MMLATLVMTARSCFNHWRQSDARHQQNFSLSSKQRKYWFGRRGITEKLLGVLIWKYFAGPEGSLVVPLWGSDGFFRICHDWELKLFHYYFKSLEKQNHLRLLRVTILLLSPDTTFLTHFPHFFAISTFSFSFECVANMMMSPTPLFPEVMAEHNFSNFSW